jgi:hypothetical protein
MTLVCGLLPASSNGPIVPEVNAQAITFLSSEPATAIHARLVCSFEASAVVAPNKSKNKVQ